MSFTWNQTFETGIAVVDQQHHSLVDLINEVSPILTSPDTPSAEQSERLLDRLFAYAATHFRTEEELMRASGLDARHVQLHIAEHAHFVQQMIDFREALSGDVENVLGPKLIAFLVHWFSFHILDIDQKMARQIELVDSGVPSALAYEQAFLTHKTDVSREALVTALTDIYALLSERRRAAEEMRSLGGVDQMTGLANRPHFVEMLNRAATSAQASAQAMALLLVDVDDLGAINQTAGHESADRLLITLAERLNRIARREDLSARIGNDEFALTLVSSSDHTSLAEAAERIFGELSAPVKIAGEDVEFSLSGGLALLPNHATDGDHLLAAAEMALREAKSKGGAMCSRFDESMGRPAHIRSEAVLALREAIRADELILYYQPQVSLHSGEIVGLEALVRWQHPTRGLVPPGHFIPLAEETGLIVPLGEWVLQSAAAQCRRWREMDLPAVRVAVNISARHFRQPGLAGMLEKLLLEHGIAPYLFELELTESVMMNDPAGAIRVVDQIKEIGVKLSLDDFGTGYSSLAYLSRFAIDSLKIDQSFVRDITTNPVNASISVATIAMAHKLGKSVIAEGVETASQMTYLRRHDCDEMQGYLFSRPVPPEAISDMLRKGVTQSFGDSAVSTMPCVLLVDDEANILNALKRVLRREGYRILTAESGPQALELLAANEVQVVVSDQRMPDMTGSELLSRVKELYPSTVRLVLSGYSELAAVTDAINRGAIYKYLAKPWNDEELKREVRQAFRHQKDLAPPTA